jgi:type IV secretory pathway VirB2 component (pilin)
MSSAWRKWIAGFYWIGVALAVACVAVVVAGHTERFALLERIEFPLSWAFAGMAGVAFLAAELCHSIASRTRTEKRSEISAAVETADPKADVTRGVGTGA